MAALVGNEYALVGDYVNSRERVTLYHKKCAKTFTVAPVDFFQGTRCPYCTENKYMAKRISNVSVSLSNGLYFPDVDCKILAVIRR